MIFKYKQLSKYKKKAFSLIEMILVIAIMGILFSVLNNTKMNVGYTDGTYYYLKQTFGNSLNINNYKYQGTFPEYAQMEIFPAKNIKLYTFYKDPNEPSGYKKIEWNHENIIIDTVWFNNVKIDRGEGIIYKVNFLTDNLEERYKVYKKDYNGELTEIDNIYNKVCLENFNRRRYCINKSFQIFQDKLKTG